MKATRVDDAAKVRSFRLNDKCAAGTGAFLEKTARHMGYTTGEIGPLAAVSKSAVFISGACAVFAESEVINHLSQEVSPSDIMQGAIQSLVERSVQLMRRVQPHAKNVATLVTFSSQAPRGPRWFAPRWGRADDRGRRRRAKIGFAAILAALRKASYA